jgi:hypothetical protein
MNSLCIGPRQAEAREPARKTRVALDQCCSLLARALLQFYRKIKVSMLILELDFWPRWNVKLAYRPVPCPWFL